MVRFVMNDYSDLNPEHSPPPPPGAPEPTQLLKAGFGPFQPDLWIVDLNQRPRVWKSWWRKPPWSRPVNRRLARHEGRILRTLQGISGVPKYLSMPDDLTLEMSLLAAKAVPEIKGEAALSENYFHRLWRQISAMHRRGVNHGDLRRKNLLCHKNDPEMPLIVDFTQSFHLTKSRLGIRRAIFRTLVRVDRVTFLKLKKWYLGFLDESEAADLANYPWVLSVGRFLRKKGYRPIRKFMRAKKNR